MANIKNCSICNKEFKPNIHTAILCGDYECKLAYYRRWFKARRTKGKRIIVQCKACGKDVVRYMGPKMYCTPCSPMGNNYVD